jgi:MOSC domain-containing protein YiiM
MHQIYECARVQALSRFWRTIPPGVMITLDTVTSEPAPPILKCVVQQHNKCAGVYATVLTPGEIRSGDGIHLEG